MAGEYLTLDEASQRFNVPIPTLRSWRYAGRISKLKRGNRVVVDAEEVRRVVEENSQVRQEDRGR